MRGSHACHIHCVCWSFPRATLNPCIRLILSQISPSTIWIVFLVLTNRFLNYHFSMITFRSYLSQFFEYHVDHFSTTILRCLLHMTDISMLYNLTFCFGSFPFLRHIHTSSWIISTHNVIFENIQIIFCLLLFRPFVCETIAPFSNATKISSKTMAMSTSASRIQIPSLLNDPGVHDVPRPVSSKSVKDYPCDQCGKM